MKQDKEVWLRGITIEGITPLLQPVAHALLQAAEEIEVLLEGFPDELLWERPYACASPGFHLLHISGVLDRLLTYAEGNPLSIEQIAYLNRETIIHDVTSQELFALCRKQIAHTLERLKKFDSGALTTIRTVGRAALPSTVIGLCTHAAEHTMRHTGQLLVTICVLKN